MELVKQGLTHHQILDDLRSHLGSAAVAALAEIDDDGIELPVLKYLRIRLAERLLEGDPEHPKDEVLEAAVSLIARLIGKSPSP